MNSVFLSRPPQAVRFIRNPREAEAARKKEQRAMEMMVSEPWCSSQVRWNKNGVTNMGFSDSDDEDSPPPISSEILDFSDITEPMTSPKFYVTPGLDQVAATRQTINTDAEERNSLALTNERMPLVGDDQLVAPWSNYGSNDERSDHCFFSGHSDFTTAGEGSVSFLTSSTGDVVNVQAKKSRSLNVMESMAIRSFAMKPRSFSQPLLKSLSSRNYSTLKSVGEEDAAVDNQGFGKCPHKGKRYELSTHLAGGTAEQLTIHPGYQNQSGISINEWQVKLGEKEPEKCRCDKEKPPESEYSITYVLGCQNSVGDSVPMPASKTPSEVEGVQTSFGSDRAMSEIMEAPIGSSSGAAATGGAALAMDVPSPSTGRRRKSIKALFRLGFLSTKTKRKGKIEDPTPLPDAGPQPPPANSRLTQRRVSRLEMNEPIEDIFSGVKFETMQKRPSTSTAEAANGDDSVTDDDEDDIIEDPEVVLRSIMDKNTTDGDDSCFYSDDVTKAVVHGRNDVMGQLHTEMEQQSPEKQLLLADADRDESMLPSVSKEGRKASEDDLR